MAIALLLVPFQSACTPTAGPGEPALVVGIAASVQPVVVELAARFEAEHGIPVTLVTGSSGTLAEQLRQGAPLDLIISADSRYTSDLAAEALLDPGSITALVRGELVAVTNLDSSAGSVALLLEAAAVRHVALANPDLAPYGDAARRYIQGQGLWEETAGRIVYGENVAQAFQFVATGNAELGFVPRSLLIASDAEGVHELPALPPEASAPLQVTAGVSAGSGSGDAARRFIRSLGDERTLETWRRFGYAHLGKVDVAER
ncbi:MAG: molybdate ABC transporter substrate-binding protein [Chloroflexota bacterium]|nr:molybdate ABC transporter substrate-binding protein [Chloroflexota bacterium]MDE2884419.1 molybdate ABC transporter substrate-binding protein [Chloroflexota bacterium]